VIIAGAGHDLRGRQTPSWAVRLGHWSFAFYLIHWVILVMISGSSGGIGALAVALWISTVVSALLYSCFERPVERWLRRKGRRRSPAPLPAPARA
jgi:peptidoglycan/LPS O-acetylase OafA/YrhL